MYERCVEICIAPVVCGIPVSDCDVRRHIKHAIVACVANKGSGNVGTRCTVSGRHSTSGMGSVAVDMQEMDEITAIEKGQDVSYDRHQFQHVVLCPLVNIATRVAALSCNVRS